ncbi:large-conductance mechanosensitive channel protein MscL [Salinisphaera sp. Q1T1-3]|uniref:large-conductance mechanosensitive channel protein MscL n=1 Tax=Salinisphaera sp. Q1T1-3 TaxID=2321229 RepID=UPI000E747A9A|nr:large-conductance mechanosensitive channel protein MscL [Salinisphaera sp. Q1T1-3]RJS93310.1 large-conductance mechanosensitive channel protein MscL [Salinisphaera sp. Q1T1-3]
MSRFIDEFKAFAVRGNVIDLAVGVVVGGAFGKIVTSLVNDLITPPLGLLIGGVDFSALKITLRHAHGDVAAVTLNYGAFIQTVINFLIVAFAIFVAVRLINQLKRREAVQPTVAPAPTREEVLLTEIRDALRDRATQPKDD